MRELVAIAALAAIAPEFAADGRMRNAQIQGNLAARKTPFYQGKNLASLEQ